MVGDQDNLEIFFLGAYLQISTESIHYNLLTIAKGTQDPHISDLNLIKCLNLVQVSVSSSLNLANISRKDKVDKIWKIYATRYFSWVWRRWDDDEDGDGEDGNDMGMY